MRKILFLFATVGLAVSLLWYTSDEVRFVREYTAYNHFVTQDNAHVLPLVSLSCKNPVEYIKLEEVLALAQDGQSAVVYCGFAGCPYCRNFLPILLRVMQEENREPLYYLPIETARAVYGMGQDGEVLPLYAGAEGYSALLALAPERFPYYVVTDRGGTSHVTEYRHLYAPSVLILENGVLRTVWWLSDLKLDAGQTKYDPLTDAQQQALSDSLRAAFKPS